jgi:hypothetical protein
LDNDLNNIKRLGPETSSNIFTHLLSIIQHEPIEAIKYALFTATGTLSFVFAGPGEGLWWRLGLVVKYFFIHLKVPGGVTYLETLFLARTALETPADGLIVEVGSWKGLSATCLSLIAKKRAQHMIVIDTFSGLPETGGPFSVATHLNRGYIFEKGAYAASFNEFIDNVSQYGHADMIEAIAGNVIEMESPFTSINRNISFAFIDVDLPASYRATFNILAPAIQKDTILLLHEGLLVPVLADCKTEALWEQLDLPMPYVRIFENEFGFRTLLTSLTFQDMDRDVFQ